MRNLRENVWFIVVAVMFISLAITAFIITVVVLLALRFDVIAFTLPYQTFTIVIFVLICILLATVVIAFASRSIINPINRLIAAIRRVSHGDFTVQVEAEGGNEISELVTEFNKMVQELGSIETLRNDFVANVSHEFKTPIAAIEGCSALLQDDSLTPEERREYTNIISDSSHRLSVLITNMLRLSKLENQEFVPEQSEFSLDEQIRQAILLLEPQWTKKDIELTIILPNVTMFSSEELLMQVWLNIIGNAVKFTPEKGEITVSMEERDKKVRVSIKDTGVGMSQETIDRIFDKFFQGDKSHSVQGNGLGLSLANRIVSLLGGTITVESEPGKGSTFTVELDSYQKPQPSRLQTMQNALRTEIGNKK